LLFFFLVQNNKTFCMSYILSMKKGVVLFMCNYRPERKILAISDLHSKLTAENLDLIKNQDYDICLLLGDIGEANLTALCTVLNKEKTFGVLGNHDDLELYERHDIRELTPKELQMPYPNFYFTGLSGSHRYKKGDYPMLTQEESIKEIAESRIAVNTYFFVSHDYPKWLYKDVDSEDYAHCGLEGLWQLINRPYKKPSEKGNTPQPPQLLIHGHLHQSRTTTFRNGLLSKLKVIGVYGCALIDYKTFKTKQLF